MTKPLGDPISHFWRLQHMAKRTHTDLDSAFKSADLPPQAYCDLLTRCRGCGHTEICDTFLAKPQAGPDAPDVCLNKMTFEKLRAIGHQR